ncbi:MAG: hypothetical protein DRP51_00090 [Candidatus Zixiibacteriota bacterium]|nr:MAG: hypothetical protein DRP51_00090 [candidate division Zixibacteria bacterium]HHI02477.1 DUF4388 domain-containing protein [candidate division Zixibacteria bacterium]
MSLAGNLKTVSFPDILQLLATGKKTGILEISTKARQKEIAFREGAIIFASSINSSEDLFGNLLLKRGKISKNDLERAIIMHKQTGRQLGTTLVDLNLFEKEEIIECLKLQIEEIVYNLFSWEEGDFKFIENVSPRNAQFTIELNTMNVIMEGTRRIDEWVEIQKVLPPDNIKIKLTTTPPSKRDEIKLSIDEFRILSLINGERTLPDIVQASPIGEFVTYRALYRLIIAGLVESGGQATTGEEIVDNEEEVILSILFSLYNNCFYRIRSLVEDVVGDQNPMFNKYLAGFRNGFLIYFPGFDPGGDTNVTFDKFYAAILKIPAPVRMHTVMSALEYMLDNQLEYVFYFLGSGIYRQAVNRVRKEITEPLALKRELVKRFHIDENLDKSIRRAAMVVNLMKGASR